MEPSFSGGGGSGSPGAPGPFVPGGIEGRDSSVGLVFGGTISGFGGEGDPCSDPGREGSGISGFGGVISGFDGATSGLSGVTSGLGGATSGFGGFGVFPPRTEGVISGLGGTGGN